MSNSSAKRREKYRATSRGGSRKANQIASEKQIASSKQSTKYVDGRTKNEAARHHRSTTAKQSTYSTTPKQSTTSSQLGGETPSSAALQGSHLCVFFFPVLPPFKSLALKPQRRHGPPGPGPEGPYARKK